MKKRLISVFILIAYTAILIKVMVFKDLPLIRIGAVMFNFGGTHEGPPNFVPFKTILPYLLGERGWLIAVINLIGNIVLLVPIGFFVPFVYQNLAWKKILTLGVIAGFAIEGMQALLHVGIFDIDDIILNGIGVLTGYGAFTILEKLERSMKLKVVIIASVIIFATVAVFYGFTMSQKFEAPESARRDAHTDQPGHLKGKAEILQGEDPCGGTGGTGQIVSMGNNTITIKRHDGVNEIINLTARTVIKNSAGALSQSDLKKGDKVTVVVMSNHTATTVLVCNEPVLNQ